MKRLTKLLLFIVVGFSAISLSGCNFAEATGLGRVTKTIRSGGTLNPMSSRVKFVKTHLPDYANSAEELQNKDPNIQPPAKRVYILIHGIYGNLYAFDDLHRFLARDYPTADVYRAEYWSAIFLPSFRSIQALGEGMTRSTRRALEGLPSDTTVYIIAHSQGGLISQYALLNLAREYPQMKFHLILLGTPGLGSDLATFAQMIVWPLDRLLMASNFILWPLPALGVKPRAMNGPLVWNNQAYNIRRGSQFIRMLHQGVQWARRTGEWDNVKVSCVVGTRSVLDEISLDDSVVGFRSAAFPARGGPDRDNIYLLPYRHVGGMTKVKSRNNLTYLLIRMLTDNPDKAKVFQVPPSDVWKGKDFRGGFGMADVWFFPPRDEKEAGLSVELKEISLSVRSEWVPSRFKRKIRIYTRLADEYWLLTPFWGIVYVVDMAASYPAEVVGRWSIRQKAFSDDRFSPPNRMLHYVIAQTDKIDGVKGNQFALHMHSTAKRSNAQRTLYLKIKVTSEKPKTRVTLDGEPETVVLHLQTNEIATLMVDGDGKGNAFVSVFLDDDRRPLPLWSGALD